MSRVIWRAGNWCDYCLDGMRTLALSAFTIPDALFDRQRYLRSSNMYSSTSNASVWPRSSQAASGRDLFGPPLKRSTKQMMRACHHVGAQQNQLEIADCVDTDLQGRFETDDTDQRLIRLGLRREMKATGKRSVS